MPTSEEENEVVENSEEEFDDTDDDEYQELDQQPEAADADDDTDDAGADDIDDTDGVDEQENETSEADETICEDEKQPFSSDNEALSEEELDRVADTAIATLRDILAYFGDEEVAIDEYEGDEGEILLDVVGDDLAILIGRHGKTLESIQFLVTSIVNKKLGFRYPVVIDIEGYKYRRKQKIEGIAHRAASKAAKQNMSVSLHPMSPYERRLVHIALKEDNRVTTVSEGDEPNRYVVIKPMKY